MRRPILLLIVLLCGILIFSGCSDQIAAEAEPVSEIAEFHLIDLRENTMIAYLHGDHWHGNIPVMKPGDSLSLGAYIENESGEQLELGSLNTLKVKFAENAPEDIISFSHHSDHIDFSAAKEGVTVILFTVEHEGELLYESAPIGMVVENDIVAEAYDETISAFRLINRADQAAGPYVHGDHWDGRLPALTVGERIPLEADVENEYKESVVIDGESLTLGAYLPGEAGNVVSFDFHDDHLYLIGEARGETNVVFTLVHNGEIVYETPPLRVTIE